ncbi:MAG: hypothetical protein WAT39_17090 [Planctomycetota bacterium]
MHLTRLVLLLSTAAPFAAAQTTGIANKNDYTINALTPGSVSCTTLCFQTPVALNCSVSTAAGNPVIFAWSFCPCFAGFTCEAPNTCVPAIPATACAATTNQSFDLQLGCVLSLFAGVSTAGAIGSSMTLNIPNIGPAAPCSVQLATQAVVLDTCGLGLSFLPGPLVLTQAYNVLFW